MKLVIDGAQQTETAQELESKAEKLNSQSFAIEKGNSEDYGNKILERIEIKGTPFVVVRTDEDLTKSFIAVGNNRITELTNEIELTEKLENKEWDLITSLIIIITERVMEGIKEEDKTRNEIKKEVGMD